MPLIEELPTTNATRISHGWAYVPDTGPSKAILPPGGRKRGIARDGAANRADGTAKQAKILQECQKACAEQGVFADHHHSH